MSLILDALKRAEGGDELQPHQGGTPTVSSSEDKPAPAGRGVLILVAGCLLGGAAVAVFNGSDNATVETPVSEVERAEAAGATSLSRSNSSSPEKEPSSYASTDLSTLQDMTPPSGSDQAEPREQPESVPRDESEPGFKGAITEADSPTGTSEDRIAQLHEQMWLDAQSQGNGDAVVALAPSAPAAELTEPAAVDQMVEPASLAPPIDLARAMEAAARELGESVLVPHPAVLLEHLSQQQKDRVPTIVYSDHDYSSTGESRVTLNGQQLRVGQRLTTIRVVDILVDSVVLEVDGIEFRLRALNTWVNL